jgi:5-methyltetrahydrofolate--homocysteine methyltransferase
LDALLERLRRGERLVGDGGWGTLLLARGLPPGDPPESLTLSRPELIEEIGRLYVEAGADLVTTNSFGASPLRLAQHSLASQAPEINRRAVLQAKRAAAGRAYVSACVGPTGRLLAPLGDVAKEEVRAGFEDQVRWLAEAGADLVCVETMTDLAEATLAVQAAKTVAPGLPVLATMTFDATPRGFFTVMGVSVEQAARGLAAAGADVVGSNCGAGIEAMIGIAAAFRRASSLPLLIQPNAGLPQQRGGELFYPENPEFMAAKAVDLLELGVAIVGGCCGTTPEHVRALRLRVDAFTRTP